MNESSLNNIGKSRDVLFIISSIIFNISVSLIYVTTKFNNSIFQLIAGITVILLIVPFSIVLVGYLRVKEEKKIIISLAVILFYLIYRGVNNDMRPLSFPLIPDFYTSSLAQFPINFLAGIFEAAGMDAYEPGGSCLCQCCYIPLVDHAFGAPLRRGGRRGHLFFGDDAIFNLYFFLRLGPFILKRPIQFWLQFGLLIFLKVLLIGFPAVHTIKEPICFFFQDNRGKSITRFQIIDILTDRTTFPFFAWIDTGIENYLV